MNNVETCTLLVELYAEHRALTGGNNLDYAEAIAKAVSALSQEQEDKQ